MDIDEVGATRFRGMRVVGTGGFICHEDTAGFEVGCVGEAVGGASQDLRQVVALRDFVG